MLGIRYAKVRRKSEHLAIWLCAVASLGQDLVEIFSFGFFSCAWRGNVVFSDLISRMSDDD